MASPASEFAFRGFSTNALPAGDRLTFWRDLFAGEIVNCDVDVSSERPLCAEAELLVWPTVSMLWSRETPMRYSRSRTQAADGDDSLILIVRRSGISGISQRGSDVSLRPGEGVGFLGAESAIATVSDVESLNVVVPRAALVPFVGDVASKTMRLVPSDCEALRLLTGYVGLLGGTASIAPELCHLASAHIHDLVAMALGATRDGAAIAESRGIRAARLRAVKADVLAQIGNSGLTIDAVALRQRITPRYVHMLFEGEGLTFSQFVLGERLMRAYRMLTDPRFRLSTVSVIAYAAGFGDLSYFNRTFRRRFGAVPSDVRRGAAPGS